MAHEARSVSIRWPSTAAPGRRRNRVVLLTATRHREYLKLLLSKRQLWRPLRGGFHTRFRLQSSVLALCGHRVPVRWRRVPCGRHPLPTAGCRYRPPQTPRCTETPTSDPSPTRCPPGPRPRHRRAEYAAVPAPGSPRPLAAHCPAVAPAALDRPPPGLPAPARARPAAAGLPRL